MKQKQLLNDVINDMENGEPRPPQLSSVKSKSDENVNHELKAQTPQIQAVGDVDKNPVFDSIARYLGIDLTSEGRAARNRRGVAMIVHGPPLSGKTTASVALAKHYECALLTIDNIIIDAIANSTSPAAARARQYCAEAAAKYAEENRALEEKAEQNRTVAGAQSNLGNPQAGLSVEALAQHSISQGGLPGGSKKTSVAGDSHTNVKPNRKLKADASNADQSSNHVIKILNQIRYSFLIL